MYLPTWSNGSPACLDLAITSPFRRDYVQAASETAGAAAEAYEAFKRAHLDTAADCVAQGMAFIPMVAERTGGWGKSGICTLKALARAQASRSGEDIGPILALQLSRLCAAVRQNGARAVLRRSAPPAASSQQAATMAAARLVMAAD